MIVYIDNKDIDIEKWDKCITSSFNGNVYAMSWYLDLVFENWSALVDGDYQRVMPLMISKKIGISYFLQPFFIQQLGVFSKSILNPEIIANFIDAIPARVKYVKVNLNAFNRIDEKQFKVIPNANYVLDLIGDYDKLYSSYSTNQKRNIKKANKNNLFCVKGVKPDDIIDQFRETRGVTVGKWSDKHYTVLKRMMYSAIHKGTGVTYGVYGEQNQLYTSAFFLTQGKKIIFLFSGTSADARNTGALSFLIDQLIKKYSSSGWVLDFEGSNDQNLARFYKGFGAKKTMYFTLTLNRFNFIFTILMRIYNKIFSKDI